MKNIHLIPTDKPSRIFLNKINGKLLLDSDTYCNLIKILPSGNYQNIYITSNGEIKDGDWYIFPIHKNGFAIKLYNSVKHFSKEPCISLGNLKAKKIILTTDQDLIKEGVQAIDDEFLEWFINNPSCEEVEVKIEIKQLVKPYDVYNEIVSFYKIIIPKEEYIKCGDCNKHYLCTTCGAQCGSEGHFIESTKQETTLDEAANRYFPFAEKIGGETYIAYKGFKAGAEWQAERSYSEKEVLAMLIIKHDGLSAEYVLEIFKKR